MIGLVEALDGVCALADIKSVQHVHQTDGRAEYYVLRRHSEAMSIKMFTHEYGDLLARPVQMIPAESGMRLAVFYPQWGDDAAFVDVLPILSWALCLDGQVRPVLPSGVRRGYNPASTSDCYPDYIQLADGSLYQYGFEADHDRYDSIDAVMAAETARAKRFLLEREQRATQTSEAGS